MRDRAFAVTVSKGEKHIHTESDCVSLFVCVPVLGFWNRLRPGAETERMKKIKGGVLSSFSLDLFPLCY